MNQYMAEFGHLYVQAAVLSENNAARYKLSIAGSCTNSTVAPYAKWQDQIIGPATYAQGMTVLVFDANTNKIIETKSYGFTSAISPINKAFITYMDSLTGDKIVMLISNGKLNTCTELEAWFAKRNSTSWPKNWETTKFNTSYSAFYSVEFTSITAEHILFNDGVTVENMSTPLYVVYDYPSDIGATGFPKRIAGIDGDVMSNGTDEIVRLPTSQLITPLADYNLEPGDVIFAKFKLFSDTVLSQSGGNTRLTVRWFNGTNMLSSTPTDYQVIHPNIWQDFEREYTVPPTADGFTIYVSKYPDGSAGQGGVRNLTVGHISREETPVFQPAEITTNGIRMNRMLEGTVQELLILNDGKPFTSPTGEQLGDERGEIRSIEFRELY